MKNNCICYNGIKFNAVDLEELGLSECAYRNIIYKRYRINRMLKRLEIKTNNGVICMSFDSLFKYFLLNGLSFSDNTNVIYFGTNGYSLNDLIFIGYKVEDVLRNEINGMFIDLTIGKRYVSYSFMLKDKRVFTKRIFAGFLRYYEKVAI